MNCLLSICKTPYFKMTGVKAVQSFFFINILTDKWAMSPRKEIMAKQVIFYVLCFYLHYLLKWQHSGQWHLVQRNLKDIDNPFNSPFNAEIVQYATSKTHLYDTFTQNNTPSYCCTTVWFSIKRRVVVWRMISNFALRVSSSRALTLSPQFVSITFSVVFLLLWLSC